MNKEQLLDILACLYNYLYEYGLVGSVSIKYVGDTVIKALYPHNREIVKFDPYILLLSVRPEEILNIHLNLRIVVRDVLNNCSTPIKNTGSICYNDYSINIGVNKIILFCKEDNQVISINDLRDVGYEREHFYVPGITFVDDNDKTVFKTYDIKSSNRDLIPYHKLEPFHYDYISEPLVSLVSFGCNDLDTIEEAKKYMLIKSTTKGFYFNYKEALSSLCLFYVGRVTNRKCISCFIDNEIISYKLGGILQSLNQPSKYSLYAALTDLVENVTKEDILNILKKEIENNVSKCVMDEILIEQEKIMDKLFTDYNT